MKFSTTFLALCLAGANAFSTRPAAFGVGKRLMMSDSLAEPEVAAVEDDGEAATDAPAAEPTPAAPTPPAPLSGLRMKDVRKAVDSLDKDNFSQTLDELESFLTHEAGSSLYAKSMRRLNVRAQALGLEIPADYAKEAKATQKKREKQIRLFKSRKKSDWLPKLHPRRMHLPKRRLKPLPRRMKPLLKLEKQINGRCRFHSTFLMINGYFFVPS